MLLYIICYLAAFLFAIAGWYIPSGLVLIFAAIVMYVLDYMKTGSLINLKGLFTLSFVGGQGVSCLKLSNLQSDWLWMTWVALFLAYMCFRLVYELIPRFFKHAYNKTSDISNNSHKVAYVSALTLTVISVVAFLIEAGIMGYIPLLVRGVPHAYSEFHVTGLHYFTVSCVLVPALSVAYMKSQVEHGTHRDTVLMIANVIALAIPILCVSRFQLIMAVGLALITYISMAKEIPIKAVIPGGLMLILVYIILTIARSHDVTYLNSIFEMKWHMPIWISQPYIYIANNYDNFNCLVEVLPAFTWGKRILFPVWALSGLKFAFPSLVDLPIYVTKKELTTVTLFYDAYYDFGIVGIVFMSAILGLVSYIMEKEISRTHNAISYVFFAQFALYLSLAFFTTWFSNPTTWFYLGITTIIYIISTKINS